MRPQPRPAVAPAPATTLRQAPARCRPAGDYSGHVEQEATDAMALHPHGGRRPPQRQNRSAPPPPPSPPANIVVPTSRPVMPAAKSCTQ